ncbi:hypothetical protein DYB36_012777 [Aphanomyces astaci]|uniref:Uncharacterized protein n=1 Tax=Aphanomyces astaci TaxID=112090 RepID=A0A397B2B4_APHAT|nr:hypothetical protein DYB36_012777 [Aphanomyces astaci]
MSPSIKNVAAAAASPARQDQLRHGETGPTILTPKLQSPHSQYQPSSSKAAAASSVENGVRGSFASTNSVVLLQHARTETPSLPLEHDAAATANSSHHCFVHAAWTLVSSVAIGAIFISVVVLVGSEGVHFLASFLVSILNYEMSWYSYAIIQTLLRPFQLYYEMDVLAPYRDTKKAVTVADAWSVRTGIPSVVMSVIVSALIMLLASGSIAILQLYGNLGLSTSTFYLVIAYVASTSFVAVACAMQTPTPMDGAILLLQQASFSINAFNTYFDFREVVDNTLRQIMLIDGGFSIAVAFVPIVILRILRSSEVARTGLTLLLDLFCLQYIPSLVLKLESVVDTLLKLDLDMDPELVIPLQGVYAIVSCFLVMWSTDLVTAMLPAPRPSSSVKQWMVVVAGIGASILSNVVLKVAVAPAHMPLLKWYHIVLMVLGSCLCHVGATFATLLRSMAKDTSLRTKWLVRLHYFLLLGFFLAMYKRVEWSAMYSTTIERDILKFERQWQRLDNASFAAHEDDETQFNFLATVMQLFENVHMSYTPVQLNEMFVRSTHGFLLDIGTCIVASVEGNVTGKHCFSGFG